MLDPFAGGGAIPLEAMRLGCEVTAVDINPVAWFILKCTLEYPQKLAGQTRRLPDFAIADREFMEGFFKSQGLKGAALRTQLAALSVRTVHRSSLGVFEDVAPLLDANLAWHVRAWSRWVLKQARNELAPSIRRTRRSRRSTPARQKGTRARLSWCRSMRRARQKSHPSTANSRRSTSRILKPALGDEANGCLSLGANSRLQELPRDHSITQDAMALQKLNKRVMLEMAPKADKSGVEFSILQDVPVTGKNAAARREL